MARILVHGAPQRARALRRMLEARGHATAPLGESAAGLGCDAAVHACAPGDDGECPVLVPGGAGMPLVVVGTAAADCPLGHAADVWVARAADAATAVDGLLGRRRGGARGSHRLEAAPATDLAGYVDFLGHELRTPLTVVSGALAALEQLAASDGRNAGERRRRRLFDLARRNLLRLQRSVTWNEDYLRAFGARRYGPLAAVALADVLEGAVAGGNSDLGPVSLHLPRRSPTLHGDAAALSQLVRQLLRSCRYHLPDVPLELAVARCRTARGGAGAGRLRLSVQTAGGDAGKGRTIRSGVGPAGDGDAAAQQRLELARLLRCSVPPALVDQLGAVVLVGARRRPAELVAALVADGTLCANRAVDSAASAPVPVTA
ncbi:MAG: hypothetical protein R6X25_16240 [Candidatus Krumholzibacteriia bacterium]